MKRSLLVFMLLITCGCATENQSASFSGNPSKFLVQLDQLPSPDFTVYQSVKVVNSDWLVPTLSDKLNQAGFVTATQIWYSRADLTQSSVFSVSNGPSDINATVARFGTATGATLALSLLIQALDMRAGAQPISTGALGDGAHAISQISTLQSAVGDIPDVQITVIWRYSNLINSVVIHGRYGGARLDDALAVAHQQAANELSGGPPQPTLPASTPTATPTTATTPTATPG